MRSVRIVVSLALLLMVASAEAVARPKPPGPVERGHAVARRVCAGCHAIDAGQESANPRATGFATREMRHTAGLAGRVADLTRAGHYGMPPLDLSPQDVSDVVAYIESLTGEGDGDA